MRLSWAGRRRSLGGVSDERGYPGFPSSTPAHWLGGGIGLSALGGVIATASGGEAVGIVIASVGGVILAVGAVAKGVEVGIRNARD